MPDIPEPGLRVLADALSLEFGVQAVYGMLTSPEYDPDYTPVLLKEYNTLLIDGEINWGQAQGVYDFTESDYMVGFAEQNGLHIQAHHLIWGHEDYLPDWIQSGGFTRSELLAIMEEHIGTVAGRYKGKVHRWSVVNEALYGPNFINNVWFKTIGPKYIELAFRWAREADPSAVLMLNDTNDERINSQYDHMYRTVKKLLAKGVPIDGVGLQMHLQGTRLPNKRTLTRALRRFGQLGVDVYITEFDVNMEGVGGSESERQGIQAAIYGDVIGAFLESGVCRGFTIFGINDEVSWLGPSAEPLPIGSSYQAKPAYYALRSMLMG